MKAHFDRLRILRGVGKWRGLPDLALRIRLYEKLLLLEASAEEAAQASKLAEAGSSGKYSKVQNFWLLNALAYYHLVRGPAGEAIGWLQRASQQAETWSTSRYPLQEQRYLSAYPLLLCLNRIRIEFRTGSSARGEELCSWMLSAIRGASDKEVPEELAFFLTDRERSARAFSSLEGHPDIKDFFIAALMRARSSFVLRQD